MDQIELLENLTRICFEVYFLIYGCLVHKPLIFGTWIIQMRFPCSTKCSKNKNCKVPQTLKIFGTTIWIEDSIKKRSQNQTLNLTQFPNIEEIIKNRSLYFLLFPEILGKEVSS